MKGEKKLKKKIGSIFDVVVFGLFMVVISPVMFITGGFARIKRFGWYVVDKQKGRETSKYEW